jgi:cell division protein FtsZ
MTPDNFSISNKMFSGKSPDSGMRVQIIGVGGAGANVVDCLSLEMNSYGNISFAVINTDRSALENSPINDTCLIGRNVTRGLGTGGEMELGFKAADQDRENLRNMLANPDIVFIVTGLGGGTGTGAAPVVAEVASSTDALVISYATLPFTFEGGRKKTLADEGLSLLRKSSDAVIPLPNDILLQGDDGDSSVLKAFAQGKDWVRTGIEAILSLVHKTGLCNIDYSTLRNAFVERGGKTLFGVGMGSGQNASSNALENLMLCPLLRTPENSLKADNLIVNITGGPSLGMTDVNEIMTFLRGKLGGDNTVFGAVIDENCGDSIEIFILGTTNLNHSRTLPTKPQSGTSPTNDLYPASSKKNSKARSKSGRGQEEVLSNTQKEFDFLGNIDEGRGYFDQTDKNLFNGEDLDIPTYLRRGIKISLK